MMRLFHFLYAWYWSILAMPMLAAGAVADASGGGDGGVDSGDSSGSAVSDSGASTDDGSTEGADTGAADTDGLELGLDEDTTGERDKAQPTAEELALQEFKGPVEQRLKALLKRAPELNQAFQRDPKLRDELAAVMRRDTAYRDVFPTVAEARQMRELFPRGLEDVQVLQNDVQEMEQVDKLWYGVDQEGNYSGHPQLLENFYRDDPKAAVAMFKTLPKQWARLDPDSYSDVMRQIMASTIRGRGWENFVTQMRDFAKGGGDAKQLAANLEEMLGEIKGFTADKPRPSEEEERIARERKQLERDRQQDTQKSAQEFNRGFVQNSTKLQQDIIQAHPALQKLAKVPTISAEKRATIVGKIRAKIENYLKASPSFMRQIREAYGKRDMAECARIQKAAWSSPHLLNRMIRAVMTEEVPQMISQNREQTGRRGQPVRRSPAATAQQRTTAPKGPHQVGGVWYKGDGTRFSSAEVLAGKHLQA